MRMIIGPYRCELVYSPHLNTDSVHFLEGNPCTTEESGGLRLLIGPVLPTHWSLSRGCCHRFSTLELNYSRPSTRLTANLGTMWGFTVWIIAIVLVAFFIFSVVFTVCFGIFLIYHAPFHAFSKHITL